MLNTSPPKRLILQNYYASHFALFWDHYKEWSYFTTYQIFKFIWVQHYHKWKRIWYESMKKSFTYISRKLVYAVMIYLKFLYYTSTHFSL